MPDKKAETFNTASIPVYSGVPEKLRQTLTLDNGKEFSKFKELESGTGIKVYFADAYSAWQRGTNENTNGLLRFYFPKGTNFRRMSDAKLAKAVEMLNHLPRKCLGYRTPHEVFCEPAMVHLQIESTANCLAALRANSIRNTVYSGLLLGSSGGKLSILK